MRVHFDLSVGMFSSFGRWENNARNHWRWWCLYTMCVCVCVPAFSHKFSPIWKLILILLENRFIHSIFIRTECFHGYVFFNAIKSVCSFPIFNLHLQWSKLLIRILFKLLTIYACEHFRMTDKQTATEFEWTECVAVVNEMHQKCRHGRNFIESQINEVQMALDTHTHAHAYARECIKSFCEHSMGLLSWELWMGHWSSVLFVLLLNNYWN